MAARNDIPPATRQAFEVLRAAGTFPIVEELRPATKTQNAGDAEFVCVVGVPHPNKEDLPPQVDLRVVVPATFPLAIIDVYPRDEAVRGFPHQDAETGKLCLKPSAAAPWDNTRLQCYLDWAAEWLRSAAEGTLLAPGDPYELPDFSRRELKLPIDNPLFFVESVSSFEVWRPWIGRSGTVTLNMLKAPRALATIAFGFPDDTEEYKPPFAESLLDTAAFRGRWLLLPDIRTFRHRPAQTYGELRQLCGLTGSDFDDVLRSAWDVDGKDFGVLLVGFPISRFVGDQPGEIHWQPLLIKTWRQDKRHKTFRAQSKRRLFEQVVLHSSFAPSEPLPWGKSTNVAIERMFTRGGHHDALRNMKIVVCGCGALGSAVSELLVRGGVSHLTLFDHELLEIGNLCRHTLDGTDVRCGKANALALRLSTTNPLADIRGFGVGIPLPPTIPKELNEAHTRLLDADLLIDCTTDQGAFIWLNTLARRQRKLLVSIFFNFGATVLTLCVSGKHTSCAKVCRRLYQDVRGGRTPVSPRDWDPEPTSDEFVIPGAGCWHPTFPAVNSHMWMLTAAAVDVLNHHLSKPLRSDGLGVLIRRNNVADVDTPPTPLVEIAWMKPYR